MFKIGVVTDEISQDFNEAIEVAKSWGLDEIELHSVWGQNICHVNDATLSKVIRIVKKSGFPVTSIDSLTLRCSLDDDEAYAEHIQHLLRSIEIAPLFNTNVVRLFSFWKEDELDDAKWEKIFEKLELPLRIAEREGVTLGFENVSSGNIGTSEELVRLFRRFDSPNLKLIWDPGNAYAAGESDPYPTGYERIKDRITHVHVKDVDFRDGKRVWLPVGAGKVDHEGQIRALIKDGYQGVVALETHFRLPGDSGIRSTRQSFDGLMGIIESVKNEP
ncbi:sugar phosphate isomerase/epimerase [Candidatus Poribacteria bacterium]|nr:sugar phosphate isomerase/epimerase [Candidatus Poribacteria bacterium]